jgi:O-acetyl-ADP-ribose deacetylase (regulator of RNase III)
VAGAISKAGGSTIQEESNQYIQQKGNANSHSKTVVTTTSIQRYIVGNVPVGGVAITNAGNLKAKKVIHAVGK